MPSELEEIKRTLDLPGGRVVLGLQLVLWVADRFKIDRLELARFIRDHRPRQRQPPEVD